MKKRISALVLSSCLLAGCAGQGAAATGETAAPSQAVPTAAPQSLTVNGLLDTSAAVGALELYAQAQNVTLQNSFETETADLVILDAPPQDDGTWKNLAENELLAAAAQRAGLDTESTVTALPGGQSLYAYWADNRAFAERCRAGRPARCDLGGMVRFRNSCDPLVRGTRRCAGNAERQCLHPAR